MKKCIVIFGGSFNPPINSHFSIAEQVLNQYRQVEKIVFVPVSKSYAKEGLEDDIHRYNMLKAVIDKNENFLLSDIDMNNETSLTTIEVMKKMQENFPEKELWLLLGSDNLKSIHLWNNAEDILSGYKTIVMERGTDSLENIIKEDPLLYRYKNNIKKINEDIKNNFSSTYIRKQIREAKSIRYLLPEEVHEYIEKNNLYRN